MSVRSVMGLGATQALACGGATSACLFAFLILPMLLACSAGNYHFDGEQTMPASQTAILSISVSQVFGLQPVIESLDAQVIHEHGSLQRIDVHLTLPPGRHQATIWWSNQRAIGPPTCARAAKVVAFDAVAGHRYSVAVHPRNEVACVLGGGDDWDAVIVDE